MRVGVGALLNTGRCVPFGCGFVVEYVQVRVGVGYVACCMLHYTKV
jgi:hypothetical protein